MTAMLELADVTKSFGGILANDRLSSRSSRAPSSA